MFFSGFLYGGAIKVADAIFASSNDERQAGGGQPAARRPGPAGRRRRVTWESIGREGRAYIASGPTAADISAVVGDPDAVEPVRAFVGLETAPTPAERAQLAVEELRRLGGFERKAIAVAGTTGSGWIDAKAANALEYATHGDVATVTTQYSYLPSWLSFLVDQSRAASNAETLITALRVELDGLPADQRPELYVFGESLGAFSTDSAFTSVEDMSTTTDGALLIGPPSFDPTWQKVVAGREPGLAGLAAALRRRRPGAGGHDPGRAHRPDADLDHGQPDHLPDPRLRPDRRVDGRPRRVARPARAGRAARGWSRGRSSPAWQATVDQFSANGVPPGHGHVYDSTVVTAWSEIVGPPSLPDDEIAAIEKAISDLPAVTQARTARATASGASSMTR